MKNILNHLKARKATMKNEEIYKKINDIYEISLNEDVFAAIKHLEIYWPHFTYLPDLKMKEEFYNESKKNEETVDSLIRQMTLENELRHFFKGLYASVQLLKQND